MLYILQVLLFCLGIIFFILQRFPAFLFGGGANRFEGTDARLLAGLLLLPLPSAFIMDWLLAARFGPEIGAYYRYITDIVALGGVLVLGTLFSRVLDKVDADLPGADRRPPKKKKKMSEAHALSIIKTSGALTYAVLSVSPLAVLFAAPVAIAYGGQALGFIAQDAAAAKYRRPAQAARLGGIIMAAAWLGAVAYMQLAPPA